ncbi:ABC transporter substrate-binding protein [Brachyspira hampsonii]|uniref:ABC transporter substrate-binding protein n=1 Tax=Brachyspira hampsonii 30446 TaxID=1289135 RepID=A0A2U4F624_9SPIR|nr:ABC transporter substrate-binding protein [Brachyspira hampsonii]EKV58197.1 ABC transporter substrate-binding protein [Brachyspira hampsonii 30446]MBW5388710.1 ABC transporter substrate-binding protein [Brachyspira hampsonii]MBW5394459.1 ABC transporter substrate-binding protein [Brachyspira hampsonii]OEJ20661.1 spermidine/putrescine ABC transporter substrate-binding protein [Brachyspira hampsonii]
MKKLKFHDFIFHIISIMCFFLILSNNILLGQKLDKTKLDLNYYEKFKGQNRILNICNWGEYIADGSDDSMNIVKEFEDLTGIKVNYTTFNSNEELYIKLKLGNTDYDLIFPTDYMVIRMIKEGLVQKMNIDLLPARTNIDPFFLSLAYDKNGEYTIPYTWGMSGIIYNMKEVDVKPEDVSWSLLFDEKYKDKILMAYGLRDSFAAAKGYLGYNINTTNETEIRNAYEALKKQKPIVQGYVMDEIFDKMESESAYLGITYGGDALRTIANNTNLNFAIPKEGGNAFVECIAIPANAKNVEEAHMFLNFLCEPQVALANANYIEYASPNMTAVNMMPDEVKNDRRIYPDKKAMENMIHYVANPDGKDSLLMESLWKEMLTTETTKSNNGIIIISVIVVILIAVIVIKKTRKKTY